MWPSFQLWGPIYLSSAQAGPLTRIPRHTKAPTWACKGLRKAPLYWGFVKHNMLPLPQSPRVCLYGRITCVYQGFLNWFLLPLFPCTPCEANGIITSVIARNQGTSTDTGVREGRIHKSTHTNTHSPNPITTHTHFTSAQGMLHYLYLHQGELVPRKWALFPTRCSVRQTQIGVHIQMLLTEDVKKLLWRETIMQCIIAVSLITRRSTSMGVECILNDRS